MNCEAKLYLQISEDFDTENINTFKSPSIYIVFGKTEELINLLEENKDKIVKHHLEITSRNMLMNYYDLTKTNARIEIGSIIRDGVILSDTAIVLMGAVINTGACIGDFTMIDMNAVIGSGAIIKNYCHIGAGAVIAGVLEPISSIPVIIEDNVFIGANATVLTGVTIGKGAIIGAGSVVTKDVREFSTVVGSPAREVNTNGEWKINEKLR